jgi:hypothetical protein
MDLSDRVFLAKLWKTDVNKLDINWHRVSATPGLTEIFMYKYVAQLNWAYISQYQSLSETFMHANHGRLCWIYISSFQHLSRDFILECKDDLYWHKIVKHQKHAIDAELFDEVNKPWLKEYL